MCPLNSRRYACTAWPLPGLNSSRKARSPRWSLHAGLIEHLLETERVDRAMRSTSYQMSAAKFPMHRDLAGFDFEHSQVDRAVCDRLADLSFAEAAHNVVFIGGPGPAT